MTSKKRGLQSPGDARLKEEATLALADFDRDFERLFKRLLPTALLVISLVPLWVASAVSNSTANYTSAALLAVLAIVFVVRVRSAHQQLRRVIDKRPSLKSQTQSRLDAIDAVVAIGFVLVALGQSEGGAWSVVVSTSLFVVGLGGLSSGVTTYVTVARIAAKGRTALSLRKDAALFRVTRASSVFAMLLVALSVIDAFDATRGKTWLAVIVALLIFVICFAVERRQATGSGASSTATRTAPST